LGWLRLFLGILAAVLAALAYGLWATWPAREWTGQRTTLKFTVTAISELPVELVEINIDGLPLASSRNIILQDRSGERPFHSWSGWATPIGRKQMKIEVYFRLDGSTEIMSAQNFIIPKLLCEDYFHINIRFNIEGIKISECYEDFIYGKWVDRKP
jgi:hypothetical protein